MAVRPGIDTNVIIQAAIEIADREGLQKVTLGALASQLKVKPPSLYNHINGLPDLRKLLALRGLRQLNERMAEAAIGKSGYDAIMAVGFAYIAYVRLHPGLYEATMIMFDKEDTEIQAAGDESIALMIKILAAYDLSMDEAYHTIRAFRSMAHGFASLELRGGFQLKLDLDESFKRLLSTYLLGLHLKSEETLGQINKK